MSGEDSRKPGRLPSPGPYLAEVVNNLDKSYMGSLEVALYVNQADPVTLQSWTTSVRYLSPFYGVTSARFEGNNSSDFNDVQKSYGMWMVPPSVGTKVLVLFINGERNHGYWIGCVQDEFQNHMVPGIAASLQTNITPEQERRYGTSNLPVAEIHKGSQKLDTIKNPHYMAKAVHPFADRLLAQGLLLDNVRGVTSSSARREVPSSVFGISTPGPVDTSPGSKQGKLGYTGNRQFYVSHLGGSTFVMDDGDKDGQNELVRIRTRTGHQILLHNSADLIYIGNSKGTTWVELTSNGKIDIYAEDSVSIHTEADFNFRAGRDINLEAGRNINLRADNDYNLNVKNDFNLVVEQNGKIGFGTGCNISSKDTIKLTSNGGFHIKSGAFISQTASANISLVAQGSNNFTANGNTNISSGGSHIESAKEIFMNGPAATKGAQAEVAALPQPLPTYSLPYRSKDAGWSDGNFYAAGTIDSIMQRVPTHEPWPQHENINPELYSSDNLDAYSSQTGGGANNPAPSMNPNQPTDWTEDKDFIDKVKSVAKALKCDYIDLLACMSFETGGTFSPSKRNRINATGLIQFLPETAEGLGTNVDFLAKLTRTQQMEWVLKYFQRTKIASLSNVTIGDLYTAILYPIAVGQPDDYVLFRKGTKGYAQNPIDLDSPKKGYATKADAVKLVKAQIPYIKNEIAKIEAKSKK